MSRRAKVTLTVSVGVFMASLDLFIVNIAFPDIQRDFSGTSLSTLSWVLNAYAITFAALLVPAGRWADRAGRKRAFLFGLGLFSAASAACALAPSVAFLIAARVVQATGAAFLLPTSLGLLLPEYPPEKRGAAVGIWAAVGGVAAAAGPPIGGLAGPGRLALGVHRQRPDRPRRARRGVRPAASRSATARAPDPTCSAPACSRSRSRR